MLCFKIEQIIKSILFFYTFGNVYGECYFRLYTKWVEEITETRISSEITCYNTSIEDYTYELFAIGVPGPVSTNFLELRIFNSNFSFIKDQYLVNPVKVYNKEDSSRGFFGLTLNFCGVKTIVNDAFKDFTNLTEIDLGFNEIDNIIFVSYLPISVKKLNLNNNNIAHLNFDLFVTSLNSLDLSFNKLLRLTISGATPYGYFPIKRHLNLNNNNITVIKLYYTTLYQELEVNLANNNLKMFESTTERQFVKFKLLDLSQSLSDLSILNVTKRYFFPDMLVFANNKLVTLDEKYSFYQCQYMDFSNCSLSSIESPFFLESEFNCLNFSNNKLKSLSGSLFARSYIKTLDISHNLLEDIKQIFQDTSVGYLNLTANRISDLNLISFQGIESLYALDLSYNTLKLNNNSFVYCNGLNILNLASCNISDIETLSFNGLSHLEILNLQNNLLKILKSEVFEPLASINEINLLNNKLTIIQNYLFSSLPVRSIVLSENNIKLIQSKAFHNLSNVNQIKISQNKHRMIIEDYAFCDLPEVHEIDLKESKISDVNLRIFSKVPALRVLDIRNNNLTSIDFSNHTEYMWLRELYLTLHGDIRKKSFLKLVFLERLTFWDSKIKNIENKAFQGLYNLEILELNNTKIGQFKQGSLYGLFKIENLDVKNILKYNITLNSFIFKDLHNIKNFDLSHFGLEVINSFAFHGMQNLKSLNLSHNKIISFKNSSFSRLGNLSDLDLSYNIISSLEKATFSGLEHLNDLNLSNNAISSFENSTFSGLENLSNLDLSFNALITLKSNDFKGLVNLKTLNLNNNKIDDVALGALQDFPYLETLLIAHNNLTEYKVGVFSNLHYLKTLNLEHNNISSLPIEPFLPLKSLEYLNLEFNNLKTIWDGALFPNLKLLKRVGIAKNKWKCDYLGQMIFLFRRYGIDYFSVNLSFHEDNIDGINCIDVCKYLLCLKDSHGIN